jgi:hypothetical protein
MNDKASLRMERIEKLLYELRYEVERGLMEREIDEEIGFRFYFPFSQKIPDGVVFCEFRTRPMPRYVALDACEPKLKLVKSDIHS